MSDAVVRILGVCSRTSSRTLRRISLAIIRRRFACAQLCRDDPFGIRTARSVWEENAAMQPDMYTPTSSSRQDDLFRFRLILRALFELLPATARTRIVSADLLSFVPNGAASTLQPETQEHCESGMNCKKLLESRLRLPRKMTLRRINRRLGPSHMLMRHVIHGAHDVVFRHDEYGS